VAEHLQDHGVIGETGNPDACALARYLNVVIGADPIVRAIRVHSQTVSVVLTRGCRIIRVSMPGAAREFVRAFDAGRFPALRAAPSADRFPSTSELS
jgi:hypothetical protein